MQHNEHHHPSTPSLSAQRPHHIPSSRSACAGSPKVYPVNGTGHLYPAAMAGAQYSAPNLRKAATQQQHPIQRPHPHYHQRRPSHHSSMFVDQTSHSDVPPLPRIPPQHYGSPRPAEPEDSCSRQNPMAQSVSMPSAYRASYSQHAPRHSTAGSTRFLGSLGERRRTKKVALFRGNLILNCPVPSRLIEASARKDAEFTSMRYSAVTCDPDQFQASRYTLRPNLMDRETELFIVMTMYNVSPLTDTVPNRTL